MYLITYHKLDLLNKYDNNFIHFNDYIYNNRATSHGLRKNKNNQVLYLHL